MRIMVIQVNEPEYRGNGEGKMGKGRKEKIEFKKQRVCELKQKKNTHNLQIKDSKTIVRFVSC